MPSAHEAFLGSLGVSGSAEVEVGVCASDRSDAPAADCGDGVPPPQEANKGTKSKSRSSNDINVWLDEMRALVKSRLRWHRQCRYSLILRSEAIRRQK